MNDNKNELQSSGSKLSEAASRAERIKAIKNSVHNSTEGSDLSVFKNEVPVESVQEADSHASVSPDNSWENDIAERIAKRVKKVKSDKASAGDILKELDSKESDDADAPEKNTPFLEDKSPVTNSEDVFQEKYKEDFSDEVPEKSIPLGKREDVIERPVKKKGKKKKSKKKKTVKESLLGLLPNKNDNVGERVRKLVFLGSCFAIIACGYVVADYYISNAIIQSHYDDIADIYGRPDETVTIPDSVEDMEEEYLYPLPEAQRLLNINSEVVGFINIPDTEVCYPVMQSDDLEKYLNQNILGEEAKAGALFLDYRNKFDNVVDGKLTEQNSDNQIVYGHNMGTGKMFGSLKNYRNDANYYGEHPIIEFNSNYACYKYKIFAFFIIDAEDTTDTAFDCWNYINFENENDFYDFVNEAKRRTLRLNNVDVQYGDKLLTLSTCNSIFGQSGGGRLIILARLVRDGEDLYEGTQDSTPNPNIKWPSLYYKYNKGESYDPNAEFVPYNKPAEEVIDTEE